MTRFCFVCRVNDDSLVDDPCTHESSTGVDQATGPDKVWRCDGCGWLHRTEDVGDGTVREVGVA